MVLQLGKLQHLCVQRVDTGPRLLCKMETGQLLIIQCRKPDVGKCCLTLCRALRNKEVIVVRREAPVDCGEAGHLLQMLLNLLQAVFALFGASRVGGFTVYCY